MTDLSLHEVDPALRPDVAHDAIVAAKRRHQREHRRPPALTAREALQALQFEALLVWIVSCNLRHGVPLSDDDHARLTVACRRIDYLAEEAAR